MNVPELCAQIIEYISYDSFYSILQINHLWNTLIVNSNYFQLFKRYCLLNVRSSTVIHGVIAPLFIKEDHHTFMNALNQTLQFQNPTLMQSLTSTQRVDVIQSTIVPPEPIENKFLVGLDFLGNDKIVIAFPQECHVFSFPKLQKLQKISSKGDFHGQYQEISCIHVQEFLSKQFIWMADRETGNILKFDANGGLFLDGAQLGIFVISMTSDSLNNLYCIISENDQQIVQIDGDTFSLKQTFGSLQNDIHWKNITVNQSKSKIIAIHSAWQLFIFNSQCELLQKIILTDTIHFVSKNRFMMTDYFNSLSESYSTQQLSWTIQSQFITMDIFDNLILSFPKYGIVVLLRDSYTGTYQMSRHIDLNEQKESKPFIGTNIKSHPTNHYYLVYSIFQIQGEMTKLLVV